MASRKKANQNVPRRSKSSIKVPHSTEPIAGHGHSSFETPHSGIEPIIRCHVCGRSSFKTPHSLQQHLEGKSDSFHKEGKPYPYQCRRCGERFLTNDGMMVHRETYFPPSGSGKWIVHDIKDDCATSAADTESVRRRCLQEKLEQYFKNHVEIDSSEMEEAKSVAMDIAKRFLKDLKTRSDLNFKKIIHVGSSFDGLKVAPPNEFDMIIPIEMDVRNWKVVDGRDAEVDGVSLNAPGFYLIRKVKSRPLPKRVLYSRKRRELERQNNRLGWLEKHFVKNVNSQDYFTPGYLLRDLQKIVHRSIRTLDKSLSNEVGGQNNPATTGTLEKSDHRKMARVKKVCGGVNGPAMTLKVVYIPKKGKNFKEFKLDLVPEIRVGVTNLVAKRHPSITQDDFLGDEPMALLWQESWAEPESIRIREIPDDDHASCRKKVWRLVKSLCLRNRHLGSLCSYFYKTLFLNFLEKKQRLQDWSADKLVDRFIDAFSYMEEVLRRKSLPVFFMRNQGGVNMLLPRYQEMMVENIYYFVRKMNADSSHMQLLYPSQSNVRKSEQPKSKVKIPRNTRSRSIAQNPEPASGALGNVRRRFPIKRPLDENSDSDQDSDLDLDRYYKTKRLLLRKQMPSPSSSSSF